MGVKAVGIKCVIIKEKNKITKKHGLILLNSIPTHHIEDLKLNTNFSYAFFHEFHLRFCNRYIMLR